MHLSRERATELLERRNRAFVAADLEAFLALWTDDCRVEGPEHLLVGKQELGARMKLAWEAGFEPLHMEVTSLAVQGDTLFYEWVFVARPLAGGEPFSASGMSAHQVTADGRFRSCREYFDPPSARRSSAMRRPEVEALISAVSP